MSQTSGTASGRRELRVAVGGIEPVDGLEQAHRLDALAWIDSGQEIYRLAKPATPPKHLVSYCPLVDEAAQSIFLVDHRLAGLWLPTGGHVDPGEDPADAAARELTEELGVQPEFSAGLGRRPSFITVTETVNNGNDLGADRGAHVGADLAAHVDVSLWYVFVAASADCAIDLDDREFHGGRWWSYAEVADLVKAEAAEPHLGRFIDKLLSAERS